MADNKAQNHVGTYYCEVCRGYYDVTELRDTEHCCHGHVVKKIADMAQSELWPKERVISTSSNSTT